MGLMIAGAIVLSVAGIAAFSILPVMIGAIADSQGLSASEAGYIAAADLCGFAVASVAAVFWIRRLNARLAATLGLLAAATGNALSLHAPEFAVLFGVRALAGVGAGTAYAVAMNVLSRSAHAERNFGLMVAAQIAYQVIALFALPPWVGARGPDAIFLTLLGTVVVALPAALPKSITTDSATSEHSALGAREGRLVLGAVALFSVNLGALWTYIERIGVQVHLSTQQVGAILAIALALSILGALGASALGSRAGPHRAYILAAIAQLAALALLTQYGGAISFTAGAVIYSLAWAFAIPFLYTLVAKEDSTGRLIVLAPAAQAIGTGLGPALAGALLAGTSYLAVNGVAAAALIASVLLTGRRGVRQGRARGGPRRHRP